MKIDRLLGILTYLLNRDVVTARALAEKFEVSPRTIQRDIDTLSLAGIPITSLQGASGGYGIMNSFTLNRQLMNTDDHFYMLTALKGLSSAYGNRRIDDLLEKAMTLSPVKEANPYRHLQLDFGVLREGAVTASGLAAMEAAIRDRQTVEFQYTNASGNISDRVVEPIALICKWYAWYVFGYCCAKQDYRLFRLSRIRQLQTAGRPFSVVHEPAEILLSQIKDEQIYMDVKLTCASGMRIFMEESFPRASIQETANGQIEIGFSVPENETGWFGKLLGYGDRITVLEPERLRHRLVEQAKAIIGQYQ